jgi:hypothetical protein
MSCVDVDKLGKARDIEFFLGDKASFFSILPLEVDLAFETREKRLCEADDTEPFGEVANFVVPDTEFSFALDFAVSFCLSANPISRRLSAELRICRKFAVLPLALAFVPS